MESKEVIDLSSDSSKDEKNNTITLDDSSVVEQRNETIELISSEDEDEATGEETQYMSVRSPFEVSPIPPSAAQSVNSGTRTPTSVISANMNDTSSFGTPETSVAAPELATSTPMPRNIVIPRQLDLELKGHAMRIPEEELFEGEGENEEEIEVPEDSSVAEVSTVSVINDEFNNSVSPPPLRRKAKRAMSSSSDTEGPDDDDDEQHITEGSIRLNFTDNSVSVAETKSFQDTSKTESGEEQDVEDLDATASSDLHSIPFPINESDLPKTCSVLKTSDGRASIYLVGTAHFSKESQDDVVRTIQMVRPNVVMVELCKSRTSILHLDEATLMEEQNNMTVEKMVATVKQMGTIQGICHILMLQMSAQITKELGMAPGGEFRVAFQEAQRIPGCLVHLGDRPINITLKRAFHALSLWQKIRFAFNVLTSKEKFTKEDVEKFKEKDLLESTLQEMAGEAPGFFRAMVVERDIFLAHSLRMAADTQPDHEAVVVGVVGIGHVKGIKEHFENVSIQDIAEVVRVPVPSRMRVLAGSAVKYGVMSGMAYGAFCLARRLVHR